MVGERLPTATAAMKQRAEDYAEDLEKMFPLEVRTGCGLTHICRERS
jgi:hypothetical protein